MELCVSPCGCSAMRSRQTMLPAHRAAHLSQPAHAAAEGRGKPPQNALVHTRDIGKRQHHGLRTGVPFKKQLFRSFCSCHLTPVAPRAYAHGRFYVKLLNNNITPRARTQPKTAYSSEPSYSGTHRISCSSYSKTLYQTFRLGGYLDFPLLPFEKSLSLALT